MSLNQPVPNNLTQVRFGPYAVDFTVAGATVIGQLEYDENVFIPSSSFVVYENALGTNATQAVVAIDNGTTGENIATATLPATPVAVNGGTGTGNLSQTIFTPSAEGYVLGQVPVSTAIPSNGAASVQSLRVNVTTAAVPSLASVSRSTTANISTIVVSATPAWLVPNTYVKVLTSGNVNYDGLWQVISVTANSFSFYNPLVTTEASTADTAATIGALYGNVYVVGLLQ
jgi:hypothetical protein